MQPSDKELDKLTGEAADQVEAPGAVPDWEAMSALLDRELPKKEDSRRRPILWFILLLFLGAGGYYIINRPGQISKGTNPIVKTTNPTNPGIQQAPLNAPPPAQSPGEKNNRGTASTPGREPIVNSRVVQPVQAQIDRTTNTSSKLLPGKKPGSMKITTMRAPAEEHEKEFPLEKNALPQNEEITVIGETSNVAKEAGDKLATFDTEAVDTPALNTAKAINKAVLADTPVSAVVKKTVGKENKRGLELLLLYAPELTTIGFSDIDKPGSSYGLLVGYRLSDRVTLQTGIIKSKKNYTADGKDYKLHYPVTYPYKLAEVSGYCNMYEVPLNVKYQLTRSGKINISALAGISSYFMTHESYVYKYTSSYNSYDHNVVNKSQQNYWLSLATVGVGFEKQISKSMRAGATPFIKLPFKGMGTGELKLISTGINFSVTFQPSFTR